MKKRILNTLLSLSLFLNSSQISSQKTALPDTILPQRPIAGVDSVRTDPVSNEKLLDKLDLKLDSAEVIIDKNSVRIDRIMNKADKISERQARLRTYLTPVAIKPYLAKPRPPQLLPIRPEPLTIPHPLAVKRKSWWERAFRN